MKKQTKKKLLTLDIEILSKAVKKAKAEKRNFSAYVELLIEKDLETAKVK
jgi:post-segregation antitoxin (ccd killing protein)